MRQLHVILATAFFFFQLTARSQTSATVKTPLNCTEFFKADNPAELTIVSDFKKLKSQKKKGAYQPAVATMYLTGTDSVSGNVSICARGEFRREQCQMPSLMVNFKGAAASPLSKLKKMKMVCGCAATTYNERLLLMEYLAYKIYNFLSDMSFRARLAKVTYKDAADKMKTYTQYAFFIEDVDDVAARNNCKEYNKPAKSMFVEPNQLTLMTLFQYMIGNTDWSIPNYHNIKLIQKKDDSTSLPYVIPYDFDFSGLVDAPYAAPNQELFAIQRVTDRLYRGFPKEPEELEAPLQLFRANKEKIMALINGFELLPEKDRRTMANYLEDFYKTINDKRMIRFEFRDKARQN